MNGRVVLLAALALAPALPVQAQTLRGFTTSRQRHGETRLAARIEVAGGAVRLLPAASGDLYRMRLVYDPDHFTPLSGYSAATNSVRLGIGTLNGAAAASSPSGQVATIQLSREATLDLNVSLGPARAFLDLGGLRLDRLAVATGASQATIRFGEPNPGRCASAEFSAGAADVQVIGISNARCDQLRFEGGMGRVVLDFRGAAIPHSHVALKLAVGEVTLRLPRSLGVQLTLDRLLSTFQPAGLRRHGSVYQSDNYRNAARHLDIDVNNAVGGVRIEWVD